MASLEGWGSAIELHPQDCAREVLSRREDPQIKIHGLPVRVEGSACPIRPAVEARRAAVGTWAPRPDTVVDAERPQVVVGAGGHQVAPLNPALRAADVFGRVFYLGVRTLRCTRST